jgi:hypothetical protein
MSTAYIIDIEIPLGQRSYHSKVTVRESGTRRIVTTTCADLEDAAGRRRAARDLVKTLGDNPAELEKVLEQRWAEVLTAAEKEAAEQPQAEQSNAPAVPCYDDSAGYLARVKHTADGDLTLPLATWTARIVEQTVVDDGAERRMSRRKGMLGRTAGVLPRGREASRAGLCPAQPQEPRGWTYGPVARSRGQAGQRSRRPHGEEQCRYTVSPSSGMSS